MIAKLPADELERRNKAVQQSRTEAADTTAVIYMTSMLKRRGATKEAILGLCEWSDREKDNIARTYRRVS